MPTYFFDLVDGGVIIADPEGQDLPDLEAARNEGTQGARELIAQAARAGIDCTHRAFRVRKEDREIVLTILFAGTIKRP